MLGLSVRVSVRARYLRESDSLGIVYYAPHRINRYSMITTAGTVNTSLIKKNAKKKPRIINITTSVARKTSTPYLLGHLLSGNVFC